MIKGRHPYPFETICLAVSFSPALPELMKETKRLCALHKAIAVFIHAGKKTSDKQRELTGLLSDNEFNDSNSRIYWDPGEPVPTILRICKSEVVDLLIVGRSDKSELQLPPGKTATALATKAKCSVLVFAGKHSEKFNRLVINGTEHKKTDLTIRTAAYFAEREKSDSLVIVGDGEAVYTSQGNIQEIETRSDTLSGTIEKIGVKLKYVSLSKENCSTVTEYAFKNDADLLITYSSDHYLLIFDRISSGNGLESMLKSSPCSMLIVHSRNRE
jgi:nucleotide-binding universal stress UspA family protein